LVEFVLSPPDIVRSIDQIWLLRSWMRLRGARPLPLLEGLTGEELVDISANLLLTDVVRWEGSIRFQIGFCGMRVMEYFGVSCPTGGEGRFLDEVLPAGYRDGALSSFHEAVTAREPVYTVADLRDRSGCIVHFERLLLPFGRDGTVVDRVLASIEAVSPEGDFECRHLITAPSMAPAFAFCAIIDTCGAVPGNSL
jgi:hypothetical protein